MAPGVYSSIGQKARDLLYGDYYRGFNFAINKAERSPGIATLLTLKKVGERLFLDAQYMRDNITTKIKVDTDLDFTSTLVVDKPLIGFKASLTLNGSHKNPHLLDLHYADDYAGIIASIGLTKNPIVNMSWVIGNDYALIGSDVAFNTGTNHYDKYNVGLSFSRAGLVASLSTLDMADTLIASYHHTLNPVTQTVIGGEVSYSFSRKESNIMIGAQHFFNPATQVKAHINQFGHMGTSIVHQWSPHTIITVSGGFDSHTRSSRFGLALILASLEV